MPEIQHIVDHAPLCEDEWVVDAKVHMLFPGMWPCIPDWHGDAIPRDAEGNLLPEECDPEKTMFLWLSGPPFTEFQDGREVKAYTWIPFKQLDIHRGIQSEGFQWRLFIRIMPASLVVRPRSGEKCLRRHSQVYLDAKSYGW